VKTGGVLSLVQVTVLTAVAVLPQPSEAVNVLICEALHALVVIGPSVKLITGILQAAVAVAEPRAAVISEAAGLQPSVTSVYEPVKTGGVLSAVQVTVLAAVAELPQPSEAVKVLVCD